MAPDPMNSPIQEKVLFNMKKSLTEIFYYFCYFILFYYFTRYGAANLIAHKIHVIPS